MRTALQAQLILVRVVQLSLQRAAARILLLADNVRLDPMLPMLLRLRRLPRLRPRLLRSRTPHLIVRSRISECLTVIRTSIIRLLHVIIFLEVNVACIGR